MRIRRATFVVAVALLVCICLPTPSSAIPCVFTLGPPTTTVMDGVRRLRQPLRAQQNFHGSGASNAGLGTICWAPAFSQYFNFNEALSFGLDRPTSVMGAGFCNFMLWCGHVETWTLDNLDGLPVELMQFGVE